MLLRLLLIFVGVCAFGVLDAIVKGHHGGMRNVIGNISAPWAILPILAGSIAVPRRLAVGALAGVASTVAALASYALARGESLRLSQSGGATLATISPIGNRWFLLGLVGGIALGASGSWFARRQRWGAVVVVVAGLLVLEPAARACSGRSCVATQFQHSSHIGSSGGLRSSVVARRCWAIASNAGGRDRHEGRGESPKRLDAAQA